MNQNQTSNQKQTSSLKKTNNSIIKNTIVFNYKENHVYSISSEELDKDYYNRESSKNVNSKNNVMCST